MKTFVVGLVSFSVGCVASGLVTYHLTKKKYYKLADEEVASVKKAYEEYLSQKDKHEPIKNVNAKNEKTNTIERPKVDVPVKDISSIDMKAFRNNNESEACKKYINLAKTYDKTAVKEETLEKVGDSDKPYVISPEEYADGDYDCCTLHYYKDSTLTDDDSNIIFDVRGTVGEDALHCFELYGSDSVYVRNDKHRIDYEILFENEEYSKINPEARGLHSFPSEEN